LRKQLGQMCEIPLSPPPDDLGESTRNCRTTPICVAFRRVGSSPGASVPAAGAGLSRTTGSTAKASTELRMFARQLHRGIREIPSMLDVCATILMQQETDEMGFE